MDNFTNYFPFAERGDDIFYAKKNAKWRSKTLQKTMREAKNDFMVVRTTAGKQSKSNRKEKVVDENDLCLNVPYSLNRKYRFQELSPWSIIAKAQVEHSSVGVLEKLNANKAKNVLASAYYEVKEDGSVDIKTARGIAANANTLIEKPKPKRRGRARKKEAEGLMEEEQPQWHPDVLYTLSKSHPSPAKSRISVRSGPKICIRKRNNNNRKFTDENYSEDFDDELREVDECDELVNASSAPKEFDVHEFVLQLSKKAAVSRKKDLRESSPEAPSEKSAFELVEFPKEIRDSIFQVVLNFPTCKWKDFDFYSEARELFENPPDGCQCVWVTRNEESIAVHFYEVNKSLRNDVFPFLKVLFEFPAEGRMRTSIDGNFKLDIPERRIKAELFDSKPTSLRSFLKACMECANNWKMLPSYSEVEKFAVPATAGRVTVSKDKVRDYSVTLFARSYFGCLQVVNDRETVSILEKYESPNAEDSNDLEVISLSEGRCVVCSCVGAASALYCFHDICIDCLRDSILSQIKRDIFPPACCVQGCEVPIPQKLLLSLLPVCNYIFFVKRSLVHIKKRSHESIVSCPACLAHGVIINDHLRAVTCSECNCCFCLNCGDPPHWPLTCDEFVSWSSKFNQQYPFEILRLDGELKDEMVVRECCWCEKRIEAGDMAERRRCCWFDFDWATGKNSSGDRDRLFGWKEGKDYYVKDIVLSKVSRYKPTCFISRQFASVAAEARRSRLDSEEGAKYSNGISRHNVCKDHPAGRKIYDIRNFVSEFLPLSGRQMRFSKNQSFLELEILAQWRSEKRARSSGYHRRFGTGCLLAIHPFVGRQISSGSTHEDEIPPTRLASVVGVGPKLLSARYV